MRVLFVARYRDASMDRKLELLAERPEITLQQVRPTSWRDEMGLVEQAAEREDYRVLTVPLLGRSNDPHRAVYRTLDFGSRRFRPDIIHVEEEPDSLAAWQAAIVRRGLAPRAKLVLFTWQNIWRPRRPEVRLVMRRTLAAADALLCAGHEAAEVARAYGFRGPIEIIPAIGVDTRVFQPGSDRTGTGGRPRIGYAGRLVAEKGLDTLIDALSQLPDEAELRLIGDGPAVTALRRQVTELGVTARVQFLAPLPPVQFAEELRRLDVLVLPSRTTAVWKEQFGRVLTEAMACRVPVIGSSSGAIPEVIGDAGLIFPEGDAAALAAQLQRLLREPSLRAELAERGLRRVQQHFTQERIAADTAAFYHRLLGPEAS